MRGNSIDQIADQTQSQRSKDKLKNLNNSLKIVKSAGGKNKNVTRSRIAISFPEIMKVILKEIYDISGVVSRNTIERLIASSLSRLLIHFTP